MTLAGGLDHDGHGFGLRGGAIASPQRDVERRIRLTARRYRQRHVAFRIQRVVLRVWLRDHSDRPGPVAPASRDGRSAVTQRIAAKSPVVEVDDGGARNGDARRQAGRADIDRRGPVAVQIDRQVIRPPAGGVAGGMTRGEFVDELPA